MCPPPSELRFLLARGVPSGTDLNALLTEFEQVLGDEGDGPVQIREKMNEILNRWGGDESSEGTENDEFVSRAEHNQSSLKDLSNEQATIAMDIVNDADSPCPDPSKRLMFLQGSAGTGKKHIVRAMLTELRNRGITYFIGATTGIAAVQYPGGETVHSPFSLGIDDNQGSGFVSHIGKNTRKAEKR
jgi:hypothetical protein